MQAFCTACRRWYLGLPQEKDYWDGTKCHQRRTQFSSTYLVTLTRFHRCFAHSRHPLWDMCLSLTSLSRDICQVATRIVSSLTVSFHCSGQVAEILCARIKFGSH